MDPPFGRAKVLNGIITASHGYLIFLGNLVERAVRDTYTPLNLIKSEMFLMWFACNNHLGAPRSIILFNEVIIIEILKGIIDDVSLIEAIPRLTTAHRMTVSMTNLYSRMGFMRPMGSKQFQYY